MPTFLRGIGVYLPQRQISNETLCALSGVDPNWIAKNVGITYRLLSEEQAPASVMAVSAAGQAIRHARLNREEIDHIIVAASFHDDTHSASLAEQVRAALQLKNSQTLDLCGPGIGFLEGFSLGQALLGASAKNVLLIGVEGFSAATKLRDRRTRYLFSDAAGAVVLSRASGFAEVLAVQQGRTPMDDASQPMGPSGPSTGVPLVGVQCWWALAHARKNALATTDTDWSATATLIQQAAPVPRNLEVTDQVSIHNPYAQAGSFGNAAMPVVLMHWLTLPAATVGAKARLFSCNAQGQWRAALLNVCESISVPDALASTSLSADGDVAKPIAQISTCAQSGLARLIDSEFATINSNWATRVIVALKVALKCNAEARGKSLDVANLTRELNALLGGATRASDRIYHVENTLHYLICLHDVDPEIGKQLSGRLAERIRQLDLAGEVELVVTPQSFCYWQGCQEPIAEQIMTFITPST